MDKKILLTSGCSFTMGSSKNLKKDSWPKYLARHYNLKLRNPAMGSIGNGLIAKQIIYQTTQLLKINKPEDILVGIMWSGIDRHEFYTLSKDAKRYVVTDGLIENPTEVVPRKKYWSILHPAHTEPISKIYYKYLHSTMGSLVNTMFNILAVQSFLKLNKIDYFMTTYMDIFGTKEYGMRFGRTLMDPDVKYLNDNIDYSKFLPIRGCYEWVKENHPINGLTGTDNHPLPYGHQKFTEEVIIPFCDELVGG